MGELLYSRLDSDRFGITVFRGLVESLDDARSALDLADAKDADLLICRVDVNAIPEAQLLEESGPVHGVRTLLPGL